MKAVIMAGGFGTRLHPLTVNIPKPLVPICTKPIMHYVVELLVKHGIKEMIVLLYHQPQMIIDHFGDGSKFGAKISYVSATEDYGTAGAVKYAKEHLDETFIVISADVVTDIDLNKVIKYHKDKKAKATVTLTRVENPLQFGIVILEDDGRIKRFLEKPMWSEVFSDTVNTGIYVFEPEILNEIPESKKFDFSLDLFPRIMKLKLPIYGCVTDGYWKDIGNLVEYRQTQIDLLTAKKHICSTGISKRSKASHSATVDGPCVIGDDTFIADEAHIQNSVIGKRCNIGRGSRIINSVIWDDAEIGKECLIKDAVIASDSEIEERVVLEEGSVVGENCQIASDSRVMPFIKLWPGRKIEEGSTVNTSMIWRQRWTNAIFGAFGVTGACNVEITPEFAAKLGSAFGAMLGKGASITSSMDGHKASRMIYRALISGILSSGVNVSNLEIVPIPINRYLLKSLSSKGGIHVRKSPFDGRIIDIKFFDGDGMDLPPSKEKTIEKLFWGEDYLRADINETGELSFPICRVAEEYKEGLLHFIDEQAIKNRGFKIVIDYSYGSASNLFPSILGELDCETVAINANIDSNKLTRSKDEFDRSLNQLSQIVTTLKADLGIMLDAGGEKVFLVDEKGRILSGETALAMVSMLTLMADRPKSIAVPVNASASIDVLAKKYSTKVIRTKTSSRSMMETAAMPDVSFVGENLGGYIFPKFQPSFDAMAATLKILELLARTKEVPSKIVDMIPKKGTYKIDVDCSNELKGTVLRSIIDENKNGSIELIDGVKLLLGNNWILVHGHPDKHEINIYSEADSAGEAADLAKKYADKISNIISGGIK